MLFQEIIDRIENNDPSLKSINRELLATYCIPDTEDNLVSPRRLGAQLIKHWDAFLKALAQNNIITELNLSDCDLGYLGKNLAEFLEDNTQIKTLVLKNNKFRSYQAYAFAEMIRKNKTITCLDLSDNPLKEEGLEAMLHALKANSVLKICQLDNISYSLGNCMSVANMLYENECLEELSFRNGFSYYLKYELISKSLEKNNSLKILHLTNLPIFWNFIHADIILHLDSAPSVKEETLFTYMMENFMQWNLQIQLKGSPDSFNAEFNMRFQKQFEQVKTLRSNFQVFIESLDAKLLNQILNDGKKLYKNGFIGSFKNIDKRFPKNINDRNALGMFLLFLTSETGKLTTSSFKIYVLQTLFEYLEVENIACFNLKKEETLAYPFNIFVKYLSQAVKQKYSEEEIGEIKRLSGINVSFQDYPMLISTLVLPEVDRGQSSDSLPEGQRVEFPDQYIASIL